MRQGDVAQPDTTFPDVFDMVDVRTGPDERQIGTERARARSCVMRQHGSSSISCPRNRKSFPWPWAAARVIDAMAKAKSSYVCQECGAVHPKWVGRCDDCGAWNAPVEEAAPESAPKGLGAGKGRRIEFVDLAGDGAKGTYVSEA